MPYATASSVFDVCGIPGRSINTPADCSDRLPIFVYSQYRVIFVSRRIIQISFCMKTAVENFLEWFYILVASILLTLIAPWKFIVSEVNAHILSRPAKMMLGEASSSFSYQLLNNVKNTQVY